ncbi:zf-TFIIB domain-containing protein [Paenibacillus sp. 2RAB27]
MEQNDAGRYERNDSRVQQRGKITSDQCNGCGGCWLDVQSDTGGYESPND